MKFGIDEMCYANNKKRKTADDGRNKTTKSRKNRNARKKKETYKYLGIFEAVTVKQAEMKEKQIKMNTTGERENISKPNYIAEISRTGWTLGLFPSCEILGTNS